MIHQLRWWDFEKKRRGAAVRRSLSMNDPPTALVGFAVPREYAQSWPAICRLSMKDPPTALVGFFTRSLRWWDSDFSHSLAVGGLFILRLVVLEHLRFMVALRG